VMSAFSAKILLLIDMHDFLSALRQLPVFREVQTSQVWTRLGR